MNACIIKNIIFEFYKISEILSQISVTALCSWPCNWQHRTFYNDVMKAKAVSTNAYEFAINSPASSFVITCLERNGQYMIQRYGAISVENLIMICV